MDELGGEEEMGGDTRATDTDASARGCGPIWEGHGFTGVMDVHYPIVCLVRFELRIPHMERYTVSYHAHKSGGHRGAA